MGQGSENPERHPSLDITDEQEANLLKLAAYLLTLPADYPDFEMSDFVTGVTRVSGYAHVPVCGTAACAVGHGPHAGIAPRALESWQEYSERLSGFSFWDHRWDWCFSGSWAGADNTVHGGAARILLLLEKGLPADWYEQLTGRAPLCYDARSGEVA